MYNAHGQPLWSWPDVPIKQQEMSLRRGKIPSFLCPLLSVLLNTRVLWLPVFPSAWSFEAEGKLKRVAGSWIVFSVPPVNIIRHWCTLGIWGTDGTILLAIVCFYGAYPHNQMKSTRSCSWWRIQPLLNKQNSRTSITWHYHNAWEHVAHWIGHWMAEYLVLIQGWIKSCKKRETLSAQEDNCTAVDSLTAEWLEQASQLYEMYCHDLEVMSLNLGWVKLRVLSTYKSHLV